MYRVLKIDDEQLLLDGLAKVLIADGYLVCAESNGTDGYAALIVIRHGGHVEVESQGIPEKDLPSAFGCRFEDKEWVIC